MIFLTPKKNGIVCRENHDLLRNHLLCKSKVYDFDLYRIIFLYSSKQALVKKKWKK